MKIFVLTPIYATTTTMQGATPVVHYFTKEWVKVGHQVTVFHLDSKYPRFYYWLARRFQHQLNSRLGMLVPVDCPRDKDYEAEGVTVHHRCFKKVKPHSLYSKKELQRALDCIVRECDKFGVPDWFVGHWDNPQLELLHLLKAKYNRPTCLVYHTNVFTRLENLYGRGFEMLRKDIDLVGFRNKASRDNYCQKFETPNHSFIASSGVSHIFIEAGRNHEKVFHTVHNFIFVGALIALKNPLAIINALAKAYKHDTFSITFVGDGLLSDQLGKRFKALNCNGQIKLTGRIPREEIISYLKEADVFIMISKPEAFGLVYLEAMALGVIPIGSRNEGIDGIIRDGENGFLCEAGNVDELAGILETIKQMPTEKLSEMSRKAHATAVDFSDKRVAEKYIEALSQTSVNKES